MRQEFLLMADGAESVNGKIYILGGGAARHFVQTGWKAPIQLRADIAAGILVGWNETNNRHTLTLQVVDEDSAEQMKVELEFETGRPPGAKPGQEFRHLIAVRGPFPIAKPGGYKVVMTLDGQEQDPPFRFWIDEVERQQGQGGRVRPT
jgi:hypothetical protein